MPLYRSCYLKHGKIKGQTFFAHNAAAATRFASTVLESLFQVSMITTKGIPSRTDPIRDEPNWFNPSTKE